MGPFVRAFGRGRGGGGGGRIRQQALPSLINGLVEGSLPRPHRRSDFCLAAAGTGSGSPPPMVAMKYQLLYFKGLACNNVHRCSCKVHLNHSNAPNLFIAQGMCTTSRFLDQQNTNLPQILPKRKKKPFTKTSDHYLSKPGKSRGGELQPPANGLLIPKLIPVAHKVLDARKLLIYGIRKLMEALPVKVCMYCPELHVGPTGHQIASCQGKNNSFRSGCHEWINASIEDVFPSTNAYHLYDRVGKNISHANRLTTERIPALIELCVQAGVDVTNHPTRRRAKPINIVGGRIIDFESELQVLNRERVKGGLFIDGLGSCGIDEVDALFKVANHPMRRRAKPINMVGGRIIDFKSELETLNRERVKDDGLFLDNLESCGINEEDASFDITNYPTRQRAKLMNIVGGRIIDSESESETLNRERMKDDELFLDNLGSCRIDGEDALFEVANHPTRQGAKPINTVRGQTIDFKSKSETLNRERAKGGLFIDDLGSYGIDEEDASFNKVSLATVAERTIEAWDEVCCGARKLMSKYPVFICGYCPEIHVGPKGHKVRLCKAFKHQWRAGQHGWQEASIHDLIPPKYVWHVRDPPHAPPLTNRLRKYYGMAPAVVELCVQGGAAVPARYQQMMRLDVVWPDLDEVDKVA